MEGDDAKVLELIREAVRAGGYWRRAAEFPQRRHVLAGMARGFSAKAATLANEIAMRGEHQAQPFIATPNTKR